MPAEGDAEVVEFTGITKLDIPPERMLKRALERGNLESVVIVGHTKDGEEFFASSLADGGEVLWLLERAKFALMKLVDEATE